jgi:hypothetical protein
MWADPVRPRSLTLNLDSELSEVNEETHVKLQKITDNLFQKRTKYFPRSCEDHPSLLAFEMKRHVGHP